MSEKHTPGPWKVTEEDVRGDDIYYRVEKEGFGLIALVDATPDCIELRANARLIAAAPALLEALRAAKAQLTGVIIPMGAARPGTALNKVIVQIDTAIELAEKEG